MSQIIAPNGDLLVTVPAGKKVAIATRGRASYSLKTDSDKVIDSANPVAGFEVDNEELVTDAVTLGGEVIIHNSGPYDCYVEVGAAPVCKDFRRITGEQGTPVAVDVTGPISAGAILGGIVTSAAAAVTGTMATGTELDAETEWAIDESVDWAIIKIGANTFTLAGDAGHTVVGALAIATATSSHFRTRKTAANTFVTYRLG